MSKEDYYKVRKVALYFAKVGLFFGALIGLSTAPVLGRVVGVFKGGKPSEDEKVFKIITCYAANSVIGAALFSLFLGFLAGSAEYRSLLTGNKNDSNSDAERYLVAPSNSSVILFHSYGSTLLNNTNDDNESNNIHDIPTEFDSPPPYDEVVASPGG